MIKKKKKSVANKQARADMERRKAQLAPQMVDVFVSISGQGDPAQLVAQAKRLMAKYTKVGEFTPDQEMEGGVVGNLQVTEEFYSKVESEGYFEASDGQVTVSIETP